MQRQSTPSRPIRKRPNHTALWIFAAILACLMAAAIAAYHDRPSPKRTMEIGEPLAVTPTATAAPAPLRLTTDFPDLTDKQKFWKHVAETIWKLPIAWGVDQPPIDLSDNEGAVFVAIIKGECDFDPYWPDGSFKVNSIGARGCGQLLGDNITEANMLDPMRNFYDAADVWDKYLEQANRDIMGALRHYRGVADAEHDDAATSVFSSLRIAP